MNKESERLKNLREHGSLGDRAAAPSPSLGEPPDGWRSRAETLVASYSSMIASAKGHKAPTHITDKITLDHGEIALEILAVMLNASPTAAQEGESQKQRASELEEWVLKHPGDAAFELANYRYELAALRKKSGAQVYEALKQIVDGDTDPAFGLPATKGLFHEAAPTWMQQAHIALEEYETSLAAAQGQKADPRVWLVWSNEHTAWWKPGCLGYTGDVDKAGRYTLADARKHANSGQMGGRCARCEHLPNEVVTPAPEFFASPVPASGWVKCSERMPERGETVLVLCKGQWCGPIAIARLWAFGQWGLAANGEGDSLNPEDVTDWMPLPAAPKGETE